MIYAEWTIDGEFHNEIFDSWQAFYNATFSPECEIKVVKDMQNRN